MRTAYVLPRHRLIVMCVPRVASSSIKDAILTSMGMTFAERHLTFAWALWEEPSRIAKHSYLATGMIRNPIDRFTSIFAMRRQLFARNQSRNWYMDGIRSLDDCIDRCRADRRAMGAHFAAQAPNLRTLDDVWPFDLIRPWWRHVQGLSALPLPDLQNRNPGPSGKPTPTPEQASAIRATYAEDVALYESACARHGINPS